MPHSSSRQTQPHTCSNLHFLPLRILTTTWNVSNASPPPDLLPFLQQRQKQKQQASIDYDIIAIALQEVPTRMDRVEGAILRKAGELLGGSREKDKEREKKASCGGNYYINGEFGENSKGRKENGRRSMDCSVDGNGVRRMYGMYENGRRSMDCSVDGNGVRRMYGMYENADQEDEGEKSMCNVKDLMENNYQSGYCERSFPGMIRNGRTVHNASKCLISTSSYPGLSLSSPSSISPMSNILYTQQHQQQSSNTSFSDDCGGKWKDRLKETLGPEYSLVGGEKLGSIRLWVFARTSLYGMITCMETMHVATGFADRGKNKGAVCVAFRVMDSGICFVGAHFAAHEGAKYLKERVIDCEQVLRKLESDLNNDERDGTAVPIFHRFDFTFLMGDLNFRLTPPLHSHHDRFDYLLAKVYKKNYMGLVKYDELCYLMKYRGVFSGFVEGAIDFPPSFKYTPGENSLTKEFNQLRLPAYCDRILYHAFPSRRSLVKQVVYESLPEYLISDHKPVRSIFEISIPQALPQLMLADPSNLTVCLDFRLVRLKCGFGKKMRTAAVRRSAGTAQPAFRTPAMYDYVACPEGDDDECGPGGEGGGCAMTASSSDDGDSDEDEDGGRDGCGGFGNLNSGELIQRDSISSQTGKKTSSISRGVRMEVHSHAGVFLKPKRVYKAHIPKGAGGVREISGNSLPCIPLRPLSTVNDLTYAHVILSFRKPDHKIGASGVLPLCELLEKPGQDYRFEMILTKYGRPVGIMECVTKLVVNRGAWIDSQGRPVKSVDGKARRGRRAAKERAIRMAAKVNAKVKSKAEIKSKANVNVMRSSPVVEIYSCG